MARGSELGASGLDGWHADRSPMELGAGRMGDTRIGAGGRAGWVHRFELGGGRRLDGQPRIELLRTRSSQLYEKEQMRRDDVLIEAFNKKLQDRSLCIDFCCFPRLRNCFSCFAALCTAGPA